MGALTGVRVLDFTWYAAGPIGTKYLADNGAEVVKIESMARLDNVRNAAPWPDGVPGVNRSQFFGSFNSSKKSVTINMRTEQGRALARQLVPHFDIVTDSLAPGMMEKWGMNYDALREIKPDLIQMSTCMQGRDGPRAKAPGFGTALSPLSGFDSITGYGERDLSAPFGAYTDFIVPRFIAFSILAALDHRQRTGEGQFIDISQFEASLQFLAPALTDYFATGTVLAARANHSDRSAPNGAYRCQDDGPHERWLAVTVSTDEQWRAVLDVLGAGEGPAEFASHLDRLRHTEELDAWLNAQVAELDSTELAARLQAAGVAAYPVQSCLDMQSDENLLAFDFWPWLDQTECGPMPYDGPAYRLDDSPGAQRAAPNVGEQTEEILGECLGLSSAEIAALAAEGVVY